jgi:hypothetical protein
MFSEALALLDCCSKTKLGEKIWGPPGKGTRILSPEGFPQLVTNPDYGNYGQTTATTEHVFIEVCSISALPQKPIYKTRIVVQDPTPPDHSRRRVPVSGEQRVIEMTEESLYYYGRFVYSDIYKKRHYSSFIYRLHRDGNHDRVGRDEVPSEYWDWN